MICGLEGQKSTFARSNLCEKLGKDRRLFVLQYIASFELYYGHFHKSDFFKDLSLDMVMQNTETNFFLEFSYILNDADLTVAYHEKSHFSTFQSPLWPQFYLGW